MGEMYGVTRYAGFKKQWIMWKRMLNDVAKSDMRMNTLLNLVVYKIFDDQGLWDQMMTFQKAETQAVLNKMQEEKVWEMNMKKPDNCGNETCDFVKNWISSRGVSDDAADMKNFQGKMDKKEMSDYDAQLDMFKDYEDAMVKNEAQAEVWATLLLKAMAGDLKALEELMNNTNTPTRRVLTADEDLSLEQVDDTDPTGLNAGLDNQMNETEAASDFPQIDQSEPTEALDAVDNVSDNDSGVIGDDSSVPTDDDSDEGTSFMTWVMYIGGVILVLVLIAGACHVLTNRKDASEYNHEQTEMGMTNANMQEGHGHHHHGQANF